MADPATQANILKEEGNKLIGSKSYAQAIVKYSEAIALCPCAIYFANRSQAHIKMLNYDKAIDDATEAIRLDPSYFKAYYRRATSYMEKGELKAALRDLNILVQLAPHKEAMQMLEDCNARLRLDHSQEDLSPVESAVCDFLDICVACSSANCEEKPLKKLNCRHAICGNCLERVYTEAMVTRPKLGSPKEHVKSCLHFESIPGYGEPITEEHRTLTPRKISCPGEGCQGKISEKIFEELDSFNLDAAGRMEEFEDYAKVLKTYRKCIWNGLVCDDDYEPISAFTQLGCEHFVHPLCLSSWLKSEISKAHEAQDACEPIVCYECRLANQRCYCPRCMMSPDNRGHVITEDEARGLTSEQTTQFSDLDLEAFNKVAGMACFRPDEGERCVQCFECRFRCLANKRIDEVRCRGCKNVICCLCGRAVHKGVSCEEFANQETERFLKESGERNNLQTCPFCKKYWGLPVHCMHATCDEKLDGCGGEFCFPCAAPRTPTMVHGTWFHRPQCPFFNNICCGSECIKNNAERCMNDKYWPGPCGECRKLESHWNKCQHSEWRPCGECRRKSEPKCLHFCTECRRQGRLCSRPDNPRGTDGKLEFRVFSSEELNEAQPNL